MIDEVKLFIRSDDINKVIVADDETGYAVASFYYQAGANREPLYDALKNAIAFIKLIDPPNSISSNKQQR